MKRQISNSVAYVLILVLPLFFYVGCQSSYEIGESVLNRLPAQVDFNFHIKPILSDRCFPCHGPDQNALKADLRLDKKTGALVDDLSSGHQAFVAGNISRSEAFQRMISDDPEYQMPPPDFQRSLTEEEIALIARWIEQGAEYKPHWSFIPPVKPSVPQPTRSDWCKNDIDYFILKKLEELQLTPQELASKEILLRRVHFDLTGLPPSLEDIEAFLDDTSEHAFVKVIDQLLASPHFGERMATFWLDLARYADSNGYSQDGLRIMWPWRDWVIKAFNENMPYDQFLSWQIAGDKIPDATQEQILATGFLRNYRQNAEGGIVDEEYRIEYAADRTETTATVFLGMTMQCARCHDHKFDPISQEEYYEFFSFFNNINERGITASDGNSGPEIVLTSPEVKSRLDYFDRKITERENEIKNISSQVNQEEFSMLEINLQKNLVVDLSFNEYNGEYFRNHAGKKEIFKTSGKIEPEEGPTSPAIKITAFDWVNINHDKLEFDRADAFTFSFYLKYDQDDPYISILNRLGSKALNFPGYEVALVDGYPMIRLVHSLPAVLLQVQGVEKVVKDEWTHLTFTYDGSGSASGIQLYRNGKDTQKKVIFDKLDQGIANNEVALTVGGRIPYNETNKGYAFIDELKIYNRNVTAIEAFSLFNGSSREHQFPGELQKEHYLFTQHDGYQKVLRDLRDIRRQKFSVEDTLVSVMVMEDMPTARPTYVLDRGMYDAPGRLVEAATPESILPLPDRVLSDRGDLARWLLYQDNPLVARVAVNRFWQLLFGRGIVKTSDDFGSQGALPSHPELLDWLACTFRDSSWDVKSFLKLILLSSTYQQSSSVTLSKRLQDPNNIYLSRGCSRRLSAEEIRDCALAASGLLHTTIGGPSVKPYQPAGLWEEKGEFSVLKNYKQDSGPNLYRRSMYTFWRRTSPPPSMTTFDAPTRDICITSRQATNTPLQALVLLNDPQFVEASRMMAERLLEYDESDRERVIIAYRLLTGQTPKPEIEALLLKLKTEQTLKFNQAEYLARDLLKVGDHVANPGLQPAEVAAWSVVCSTIMSFDETIMKR